MPFWRNQVRDEQDFVETAIDAIRGRLRSVVRRTRRAVARGPALRPRSRKSGRGDRELGAERQEGNSKQTQGAAGSSPQMAVSAGKAQRRMAGKYRRTADRTKGPARRKSQLA